VAGVTFEKFYVNQLALGYATGEPFETTNLDTDEPEMMFGTVCAACGSELWVTDRGISDGGEDGGFSVNCRGGCKQAYVVAAQQRRLKELDAAGQPPGDWDTWLKGSPMDPTAVSPEPLPVLDGIPFLHAGMAALIAGPTGGGRSMVFEACIYDAARAGLRVAYLGSEITKDEFHARAAVIADKRGHTYAIAKPEVATACYLDLAVGLKMAWKDPERWLNDMSAEYDLIVIDPLGDALSVAGIGSENREYVDFYKTLIEPLRSRGPAIVMLDNVGHAEDAQNRAIGQSAKLHKADLIFHCAAEKDPLALTITLDKVRTIRTTLKKGDTWKVHEGDLVVEESAAARVARKPTRSERIKHGVLTVLIGGRLDEADLIKAVGAHLDDEVARSTVQRLLGDLEVHERVVRGRDGKRNTWALATAHMPTPLRNGANGQLFEAAPKPAQNAINGYDEGAAS
jgi:ABC-type iron transport system FetAB ATPase subunit